MPTKTCFFLDNTLYIIYNNQEIHSKLPNIIAAGMIINKELFLEEFLKIAHQAKLKNKLFGEDITLIKNSYYTNRDLYLLENIFLELGYLKVHFKSIKDFFKEENATFIEINQDYLVIHLDNGIILDLKYFNDIPKTLNLFKNYFSKNLILFGTNPLIPTLKIPNFNIYYFENYSTFIVDNLINTNNQKK